MNAQITTTRVTQVGNEILGKADKIMYYLIIETDNGRRVINIGEKTYKAINEMI